MLSATPRFPDDDSTSTDPGWSSPSRSAASTISLAAFNFTEPAKLKPSIFRNSDWPDDRLEVDEQLVLVEVLGTGDDRHYAPHR